MLICFDLGGVLIKTCRNWSEGCQAANVQERPFPQSLEFKTQRSHLIEQYQIGALSTEKYFNAISDLLQGTWSAEEINRVHTAWILGPYEHTHEFITEIHDAGHETACLSNTNESHWEWLVTDKAFTLLNYHHASHLLGLHKPDPAIWTAFEQAVGKGSQEIIYFDDLTENVDSAIAAGWDAIHVDPSQATVPQMRKALADRNVI